MPRSARLLLWPTRAAFALFALYAAATILSLAARWGLTPAGGALLAAWLVLAALAWPIARDRISARTLWPLLIAAGFVLRLAVLPLVEGRLAAGDPAAYLRMAADLLAGRGLRFGDPASGTLFLALYPPAYPLFLAAIGATLGLGGLAVLASNLALDLLAAALLARIGRQLGAAAAGRAAAWLLAIWPSFVLAAPLAQKESLLLAVMLGLLALIASLKDRAAGWPHATAFGIGAALLALTQPGLALFPGLLGLALLPLVGWRALWRLAWRGLPFAVLAMLPWWLRNYAVLGHFVPLTSTGGIGLWIGNNPEATGSWMPTPASWGRLDEIALSARAAAEAKAWILGHPADFVRLTATKLVRAMGVEQFPALRLSLMTPAPPAGFVSAIFTLCHGALIACLAAAALLAGRALRSPAGMTALLLTAAALAQIALFGVWFEFGERHRYPLMPFLFLLVACAAARQPISASQPGRSARLASSR